MEQLNTVNDVQQTAVESAAVNEGEGAVTSGTPDIDGQAEVTVRRQSAAENSGFRKLRLENERLRRELESRSDYDSLKALNSRYAEKLAEDCMARDLEKIRSIDPGVKRLEDLGGDFLRLIENGTDAVTAYSVLYGATDGKANAIPPSLGAVGFSDRRAERYFSSRELDRLSARDLEDPAIYKKAMESLKRL